jgi:K+ transporter
MFDMKMKSALRQHHQRVWRARGCLTQAPTALLRALKHYKGLHQRVIMMQVDTEDVANVPDGEGRLHQVEVKSAGPELRIALPQVHYRDTDIRHIGRSMNVRG